MLTLNKIIILRNVDLKRFFNIEEFWKCRKSFFQIVDDRKIDVFFDTEKEKICYLLFKKWNDAAGNIQAEIKESKLIARVNNTDRTFDLGRLSDYYKTAVETQTSKNLIGLTLLYLMLGADEMDSDIEILYESLSSHDVIPKGDHITRGENWTIPNSELTSPLSRKVIANTSEDEITISSGDQHETLKPNECVIGLFTNSGCYRLLPHRIVAPDNSFQLLLSNSVGGVSPNLQINSTQGTKTIGNVYSFVWGAGNFIAYLQRNHNGTENVVYDDGFYNFKIKYSLIENHFNINDMIAFEQHDDKIVFYFNNGQYYET